MYQNKLSNAKKVFNKSYIFKWPLVRDLKDSKDSEFESSALQSFSWKVEIQSVLINLNLSDSGQKSPQRGKVKPLDLPNHCDNLRLNPVNHHLSSQILLMVATFRCGWRTIPSEYNGPKNYGLVPTCLQLTRFLSDVLMLFSSFIQMFPNMVSRYCTTLALVSQLI